MAKEPKTAIKLAEEKLAAAHKISDRFERMAAVAAAAETLELAKAVG